MQGSHPLIQLIWTSAPVIATVTSSDSTSGRRDQEGPNRPGKEHFIALDPNKKGFLFSSLFLTPKDEDLHVNENSRKRKLRLHYGASVRRGRRRSAAGKSRMCLRILRCFYKPGRWWPQTFFHWCQKVGCLCSEWGGDARGWAPTPGERRGPRRMARMAEDEILMQPFGGLDLARQEVQACL